MTSVLILIILACANQCTPTVTPIYFDSMEACEAVQPSVLNQVAKFGVSFRVQAACYEEAAK